MIIHELHIKGFGKWRNRTFTFAPGINLFTAPNESGKSTLLQAIFASLYGMKRDYVRLTRYLDEYDKYLPWDQGPYETIVQYQLAGQVFRLHRQLGKEREQAKLYLDQELLEITRQYQEDKRKEYNFLERHLTLNRTLFTDVTWVKREGLQAAEYLLPSLSQPDAADPLVNRILAGIDQELAQIGKKENAENTLLGKAAKRVSQTQREMEAAEQAWQTTRHLSQRTAEWQVELSGLQRQHAQLLVRSDETERLEEAWQEMWQQTFHLKQAADLDEWQERAETEKEREVHLAAKDRLKALEMRQNPPAVSAQSSVAISDNDWKGEKLQHSYETGWKLVKSIEEKKQTLFQIAATLSQHHELPNRREQGASRQMKKKDSKVTIAFASTGLLGLAALIGFFLDAKLIGFVTGVLALLSFFIGLGRQAGAHRKVGETEQEQIWSENGQNLLQPHEVERLRAEQRQNGVELTSHEAALASLLAEWQAGSWEEFLARREQALTEQHQKETDRLSGALQEQQEKDQIIAEWADKVREFLQLRKTQINKRRDALKQEIRQVEELTGNLREQIAKANGEAGRSDQHSWAKARSEYEEAAAALDELLLKRESLVLAKETLRCALHDWQREMSPDVNRFASAIMAEITGGSYRDVRLDPLEKFSVRAIDPRHQKVVEHHQVSSGTQDQLYFAQRIALLQHVSTRTGHLPLFLDDHFIHYDEERLAKALDYLVRLSEERQIFLFSCQEREKRLLQATLQSSSRHAILEW